MTDTPEKNEQDGQDVDELIDEVFQDACILCERPIGKGVPALTLSLKPKEGTGKEEKDKHLCAQCAAHIARAVMEAATQNPALAKEFGINATRQSKSSLIDPATGRPFN